MRTGAHQGAFGSQSMRPTDRVMFREIVTNLNHIMDNPGNVGKSFSFPYYYTPISMLELAFGPNAKESEIL